MLFSGKENLGFSLSLPGSQLIKLGLKIVPFWLWYSLVCLLDQARWEGTFSCFLHHFLHCSHGSSYCSGLRQSDFLLGYLHAALFGVYYPLFQLLEGPLDWWKKILCASAAASVVGTSFFPLPWAPMQEIPLQPENAPALWWQLYAVLPLCPPLSTP